MILGIFLIMILGYFLLYNTSKKVKLGNSTFETWLQSHKVVTKIIGVLLLLLSLLWFVYEFGLGIGLFYGSITLMTIISLLVIILPLRK